MPIVRNLTINKQQFDDWLEHPVTQDFIQYFRDVDQAIVNATAEAIADGTIVSEETQIEISAKREIIGDVIELTFEEIESFYTEDEYGNSQTS